MLHDEDAEFFRLFSERRPEVAEQHAPAHLKARVDSALIREQQKTGPLQSISACKSNGRRLCIFENLVEISPVGESAKTRFFCWSCHARVIAENTDTALIFWPGCPYAAFQKP